MNRETEIFINTLLLLSCFSHDRLFATPWTVAHQAPLYRAFSRQEQWSGLPCLSPGDLPDPGIEPVSPVAPALQADSLLLSHGEVLIRTSHWSEWPSLKMLERLWRKENPPTLLEGM